MAKQPIVKSLANGITQHRVRCEEGDYNGVWHNNEDDANEDAELHWAEPGCEDHVIKFITRQTSEQLFRSIDKLD